jgi:hypothetical protein
LEFSTIPKACGFEAATLCVAGVSPARQAGILPDVFSSLIPVVVMWIGMLYPITKTKNLRKILKKFELFGQFFCLTHRSNYL